MVEVERRDREVVVVVVLSRVVDKGENEEGEREEGVSVEDMR